MLKHFKTCLWNFLQTFLVRRGLALFRVPSAEGLPPSLVEYLQNLSSRGIAVDIVFSFDDEPQIQKEFLNVFPADQTTFISVDSSSHGISGFPEIAMLKQPQNRFLVEIDYETFDLWKLIKDIPWLLEADVLLLRSSLGHFWCGAGDLQEIVNALDTRGFGFFDVLEYFKLHLLKAPLGRIVFIFENQRLKPVAPLNENVEMSNKDECERLKRIKDSLVFLSNPIARVVELVRLGGRGSFGFAAGVVNPGAIANGDRLILLARGEIIPWNISKHYLPDFLSGWRPALFELSDKLDISHLAEVHYVKAKEPVGDRMEDFRLFRHQNQLLASHTWVAAPNRNSPEAGIVRLESLRIQIAISQVDMGKKEIKFLGSPKLDCATGSIEKNWVFFEHKNDLYLIYSFSPFHLLRASQWPQMDFITVIRQPLSVSIGDGRLNFRNSANPVEYDAEHFLHVVHKVYPGKQYVYWAVLIEKNSLLPKKISARPLVCGWKSAPASIIYACSVVVRKEDVLIFCGLNDSSMGFWKISRQKLDESWLFLDKAY